MTAETIRVRTVRGDVLAVSRAQYEAGRTQLSIYTATGKRLCDYYETMRWGRRPTTLHRANIAEVLP